MDKVKDLFDVAGYVVEAAGVMTIIAGDIIRTVTVTQTLESVGVLVVIVLIRSFLTMTLELEIEGRWPWQQSKLKG